ncbi:MAG: hypothetical protein QOH25_97 [Acidobacteriota bacterium]|nr:hypothetical protein [Acidobacteriota bacterium]
MKRKKHAAETSTCPSCLALNNQFDAFCLKCGYPLGAVATIDPLQSIRADTYALNKAVANPNLRVLLFIGIPALIVVIGSVGMAVHILRTERGAGYFFYFWMMIGAATLAFALLYRIVKNYFKKRQKN